jgi:hypothetical protein
LFDIFIDDLVAGLHDTCSEHGICMGQTDVASLLYADDANALSFTPMVKVDGLHPPGSTNGGCKGISPKVAGWYFTLGG